MPTYGLFNKKLETFLTHPKIGVWSTKNYQEAKDMLDACLSYVNTLEIPNYDQYFEIIDLEDGDKCPTSPLLEKA